MRTGSPWNAIPLIKRMGRQGGSVVLRALVLVVKVLLLLAMLLILEVLLLMRLMMKMLLLVVRVMCVLVVGQHLPLHIPPSLNGWR